MQTIIAEIQAATHYVLKNNRVLSKTYTLEMVLLWARKEEDRLLKALNTIVNTVSKLNVVLFNYVKKDETRDKMCMMNAMIDEILPKFITAQRTWLECAKVSLLCE